MVKNKIFWAACAVVFQLDRIPAYRRYYTWIRPEDRTSVKHHFEPVQWRFTRNGRWGFNLLRRVGLLWPYIGMMETDFE